MRGIDNHRQMRLRFQYGDGIQIERVARVGLEGADAALAEQHVEVAFAQNVFRAHEQVFDGGAHAALEHDGELAPAHFFQKGEVLHVARADLEAVGVLLDHLQVFRVHDLGNHRQAGGLPRFREQFQTFEPQPLEGVGRSPRLEGPAPQHLGPGRLDVRGDRGDLLPVFHRARTGHDRDLRAADGDVADLHHAVIAAAKLARDQLVRLQHRRHRFHAGDGRDRLFPDRALVADDADDRAHRAAAHVRLETPLGDPLDNVVDLFFCGLGFGDDNHGKRAGRLPGRLFSAKAFFGGGGRG